MSAVGKQAMKYPPTTLGGVAFTKKELESWAKRVLSSQNGLDNERNQRIAREAVATYDKVYEVGEGVERVYVAPHPEWGARGGFCFHVVFEDGHEVTVARAGVVRACFDPKAAATSRRLDKLHAKMREDVYPFVGKFKDDHHIGGWWKCELCAESFTVRDDVHVDHLREFRFMVQEFKKLHPNHPWDTETRPPCEWENWHNRHATLRILCKTCNLRRRRPTHEA